MPDFLDRVRQTVGKGVTTVSVKSKEVLEATKVKSQIDELGQRRKGAIEELGSIAFAQFRQGPFDPERLTAKCAGIKALDDQIEEKQRELSSIHARAQEALGRPQPISVCGCGADLHQGVKFCGKCGAPVRTARS